MQVYDIILIGIALSIDACALTIANCATYKNTLTKKRAFLMPFFFGAFQGVMPLIGFYVGTFLLGFLGSIIEYFVSVVFFLLAVKIIVDIVNEKKCREGKEKHCKVIYLTIPMLLLQAVATSIDALVIGVTFFELTFSVFIAVLIIAVITFVLVWLSLFFGKKLGTAFGSYAEWVGAGILLFLAVKNLIQILI